MRECWREFAVQCGSTLQRAGQEPVRGQNEKRKAKTNNRLQAVQILARDKLLPNVSRLRFKVLPLVSPLL